MPTAAKEVTICNTLGLHARPAMQFVDLSNQFSSRISVFRQGDAACEVDGKSVMQMITLEASAGTRLRICADGDDAETAVQQLAELVENKFGED
jgi:phosphocarrier protein HPr